MPKLFDLVRLQGSQIGTLQANPTFVNGSPTLTAASHGYTANQPIRLTTTGGLPTNFATGTTYFVRSTNLTANTFELSATAGGAAITAGSAGSGTHTSQGGLLVDTALSGWLTFSGGGAADGDQVTFAINDTSHNLIGEGVYHSTGTFLSIVTILKSSNSNNMISLTGTQQIGCTESVRHFIDKGTKMLFVQTAAPTGWTIDTDQNDKALRIVSGASGGSAGGTLAFSTVFGKTATDGTALTNSHLPTVIGGTTTNTLYSITAGESAVGTAHLTGAGGSGIQNSSGGNAHSHGMDIRVQYVDVIKATKD